jgi:glycosyltransferase involved in cell wall biosynthesis
MKMCEEFSLAGVDIELIVPNRRSNEVTSDPFEYYSIKNKFPIKKLWSFDLLGPFEAFGKLFYWIDMLSFLFSVKIHTKSFNGIFYTRDYLVPFFLPQESLICLEVHDLPSSKKIFKRVINRVKLFVVLNNNLRDELVGLGVRQENILVSPSGIDLSFFDIDVTKEEAREKLSLPLDKKIVTYTGHFYKWKGVYTLAEVAKIMPETVFVFIGGVEPDITSFKNEFASLNNIIITPFKKRDTIPLYLKASNVLVLPNSGVEKISNSYTSPLKMFEYMASRVPIVASDLSSIREVLNESNSLLSVPDSVSSFELSIKKSDIESSVVLVSSGLVL